MQLGQVHLSPEERLRRPQAGKCLYCGQPAIFTQPVLGGQKSRLASSSGGPGEPSIPFEPLTSYGAKGHTVLG